jgi:hypothetical protein
MALTAVVIAGSSSSNLKTIASIPPRCGYTSLPGLEQTSEPQYSTSYNGPNHLFRRGYSCF